ncbi:MAG: methyltransferase domain-containing protein [Gammaproteobacteria bacterium]|nr:methyltransferase domain-containing protein [Gammaproteobacteria bacterium]
MINEANWTPSKYVFRGDRLMASRDPGVVGKSSRLIADITAGLYQTHIPRFVHGRLLDLGCGLVPLFGAYRNYATEVVCIDWENSPHKSQHLDHVCDLGGRLPFPDGGFNTIILSDVLEHIPRPENLWQEMARISADKAIVMMNTPFFYRLHEVPHDYYRYTEFALRRFASLAGFRVVLLQPVGGIPEIFADLLAKRFRSLAAPIQYLTSLFLKTGTGRRLSAKTGTQYPLGYFLVAEKGDA